MTTHYDSLGLKQDIVMDLSWLEGRAEITHDESKTGFTAALHNGVLWRALAASRHGLNFHEAMSRYIDAPVADTAALDFTATDYSLVVWIDPRHWLDDDMLVMGRYAVNLRGWELYHNTSQGGIITLRHHHPGVPTRSACYSLGWPNNIATMRLFGVSRIMGQAQHYRDGQQVQTICSAGGLLDPAANAVNDLTIGCRFSKDDHFWTGMMHRPRAWTRALGPHEHRAIFELERDWFGV